MPDIGTMDYDREMLEHWRELLKKIQSYMRRTYVQPKQRRAF